MKSVVISLGGSIIAPNRINTVFLRAFRKMLRRFIKKGTRFIVICGGGKTAREYQAAASRVRKLTDDDLDWLGIHATRLNAHLMRTILRDISHKKVIRNPTEKIKFKENVLIAAGWKPGWSTDYDAVLLAKNHGIKTVVNITNVDHVYDKNPSKYKDAKPLKEISWAGFRKLVGNKWDPGLNTPFDPLASKEAEKLKLKVIIIGKNLKNLDNFLNGKKFKGTVIG
ncbi:MAG: UMP kinase [bacterium]|nr:UMP kinase [bacterium]